MNNINYIEYFLCFSQIFPTGLVATYVKPQRIKSKEEYTNRKEKQDTPLPKDNQRKDASTAQLKLTAPQQVIHNSLKNRFHSLNIYILMREALVTQSCPTLSTPRTTALQAPAPRGYPRRENWSVLPFPSPGELPHTETEPGSPIFIDHAKAFHYMDDNKLENSSRDGNTRPPDLPPEKSVCRSRSNSQKRTWNRRLVQNWERSMLRMYIDMLLI